MAKDRLIGDYGKYATGVLGADVTTGTLTADTLYVVKAVGTTSQIPTGSEAKYVFLADGTEDLTSSGGDIVAPFTITDSCDFSAWSLEFTKDETEVTTFCDTQKKYLVGKTDATGNAEGITTIGITDKDGGLANKFIDIVRQAGPGATVTIDKIDDANIYAFLYTQEDQSSGETEQFWLVPASVTSYNAGATLGDSQSFSSGFRIAPDDTVEPQLVNITYP